MTINIVERLREPIAPFMDKCRLDALLEKAADRIEKLEAALEWIVGTALTEPEAMVEKARAALEERT